MRLRALLVVPALLVAGVAAPAAAASTAPSVGYVDVAGDGPGDLVRTSGYDFPPGVALDVTMSDGTTSFPLAKTTADTAGRVVLPSGTRIPLAAPVTGRHWWQLTFSGAGGLSVSSSGFTLDEPYVQFWSYVPGRSADLAHSDPTMILYGLANTPDVVRSVTIDGQPVAVDWFSDDRAFDHAGIAVAVPADLALGRHEVTFTQTGPTPYTVTFTPSIDPPTMTLAAHAGIRGSIAMSLAGTVWNDDFDVTVVGAAGDRHPAGVWSVRHSTNGSGQTAAVRPVGTLSTGVATVTAVSRTNHARVTGTVVVDAPSTGAGLAPGAQITSPDGATSLLMQTDGNLVEAHGYPGTVSQTVGHPGAYLTVQSDGNLVVRAPNGAALWNTGTAGGGPGAHLGFDSVDSPVLVLANGRTAWSAFRPSDNRVVAGDLRAGGYLFQGQTLSSSARADLTYSVNLDLQTDGNLVLNAYGRRGLWATRTVGHPGCYLTLQTDGNLVLRAANGVALWANGVRNVAGARLQPQFNGDLGEFAPDGRVVWHLGTRAPYPTS